MSSKMVQPVFDEVASSKNLSQLVRSNAPEYWAYVKRADLSQLKAYLSFVGTCAGDPHLGNFGPIPVTTTNGTRVIRFVNIDFDDCGRSPFVLDYVRYIAAIKAQCIEMRTKQLLRAYLAGLRGKALKPPQKVRALMKMNVDAYDALADNYMAKNTSNRKFKPKPGAIEAYRGKVKRTSIAKLFPGESLLDLAHRIEERGGSVDEARIWALVEAPDSHIRIMEIKGYAKPGTANYMAQPAVDKWLGDIRSAFWPGLTGAEYDLITLEGKRYWLRQKRVALINVPYSSQKKQEIDLVIALAIFDANILGLAHGRQTAAAEYTRAIRKNPAKFHRATKKLERVYLAYAKREMKKRQRAASAGGS